MAWSYILYARWAEVMPGLCTLTYGEDPVVKSNGKQVPVEHDTVVVDVREVSPDEARWWSAIVAEDHG